MIFNTVLLSIDLVALGIIFRYRTIGACLAVSVLVAAAGIGLGAYAAGDVFHFARLAA
jgi:hypothetical protein